MSRSSSLPIALAAMLLSSTSGYAQDLPASHASYDPAIVFPEIRDATRPQGAFVPLQNVLMITNGMKKSQIYTLLDVPHFHEGLFGVREWNYIFHFYTGAGDEYRTCQYQLHFDGHARVTGMWWRDGACAALRIPQAAPVTIVKEVAAPAAQAPDKALKTYDFTFDFDSVTISPVGHDVLRSVIDEVAAGHYRRIVVTGFTDTKGSVAYNDALAARRGAAVMDDLSVALRQNGSRLADQVFARGGRDLAIPTGQEVREVQNRRVRVELF